MATVRYLVIAVAFLLVLAACGTGSSETPTAPTVDEGSPAAPAVDAGSPEAAADPGFDAEAYFRGKTIQLVSISPPGGGTDAQSRVLAAMWGKFIPGNPRIVVSNIARVAGYNYMYNAQPDGYTLMYKASPGFERQISPDAQFVLKEFPIIAAIGAAPTVWVGKGELPYNTVADAVGASGPPLRFAEAVGSPIDLVGSPLVATFLCDRLQMPCEPIAVAEAGTNAQMLMFDRGEINSNLRGSLWWNLATLRPGAVANGEFKALVGTGSPDLPVPPHPESDAVIPNAYEFLDTDEERNDYALVAYPDALFNKAIAAPPNTPEHLLDVFEEAFRAALADDEFARTLSDVASLDVRSGVLYRREIEPIYVETYDRFFGNQDRYAQLQEELYARYWE